MIDSEAPLHICKATEPPAVKIREINLRSCRRESNPRRQHDERASYPLGHRGSLESITARHRLHKKLYCGYFALPKQDRMWEPCKDIKHNRTWKAETVDQNIILCVAS